MTIYTTGTNLLDIFTRINTDIGVLNDWLRANQLSANPPKTRSILKMGDNKFKNVYMDG